MTRFCSVLTGLNSKYPANENRRRLLAFVVLIIMITSHGFAQNSGFVVIKSIPSGAEVFINGKSTLKKTTFQALLDEGNYDVELKYDLYHSYKEKIAIVRGKTLTRSITLKPAFGTLKLTSVPDGADVTIDGIKINGETPLSIPEMASGEHIITLTKAMYALSVDKVIVTDEVTTDKRIILQSGYGSLNISSNPETVIAVDGATVGTGNQVVRLIPGKHKIKFSLERYSPVVKEINVIKGQNAAIEEELRPFIGSILVMVDPPESDIYLNGKNYGLSPKIIDSLAIGEYNLMVKKEGYAIGVYPVLIEENKTYQLNAVLKKGKIAKITTTPSGADIIINDKQAGTTPGEIIVNDGVTEILLKKKYYLDKHATISAEKEYQTFDFALESNRKLLSIGLGVETHPNHADIKIDKIGNNDQIPSLSADSLSNIPDRSPFTKLLPAGEYKITISKKHYKVVQKDIILNDEQNLKINLEPVKYRTKGNAILLSVLWPGAGQSYLHRGSAHWLMGIAGYGLAAGAYYEYHKYISIDTASAKLQNNDRKMYMTFFASAGAVWASNLLWTILTRSEIERYQRLNLTFGYNNQIGSKEIGLKMRF